LSSLYASQRPETLKVAVQHHHAHVVSAMVEHGVDGPAIGIAYDGTGYGTDGTMWGGEVLLATREAFHRVATFRPLLLAGGDRAIREPWRLALALVVDAFDDRVPQDVWRLFGHVAWKDLDAVRAVLNSGTMPLARGVGRYFDAFGALLLDRPRASYEGQIAFELNMAADPGERGQYGYAIDHSRSPWEIDLRPAVRDAVFEFLGGEPVARIAARIHNTLAAASVDAVRDAARGAGRLPVVLSGGCFQNARLAEAIVRGLQPGFSIHLHERVPPGDGGIALGQAVVAAARARCL
jgi:hydrogenase maturation protein HypF